VVLKTTPSPHENVSNYNKIVTPLSADGFDTLLHRYNLTSQYPNLSWNLRNGFPLGEFDYLHDSYIHPNHPNSDSNNTQILKYIQDEVSEDRMSGPFTLNELKKEARGEVIVSPLGAVDKAGEPGKLRIIRDLSFQGKAPFSVNDKIDPNSYLTKWSTAAMIIDLVSPSPSFILLSVFLYHFSVVPAVLSDSCTGKRSYPILAPARSLIRLLHRQETYLLRHPLRFLHRQEASVSACNVLHPSRILFTLRHTKVTLISVLTTWYPILFCLTYLFLPFLSP